MTKIIEGKLTAKNKKFGVVVSRFNELISTQLLAGAQDCLTRHEGKQEDITVALVPARSNACSIVSAVIIPKITGKPASNPTCATPLDTSAEM